MKRTLRGSRYVQRLLDSDPALLPWLRSCYATPGTVAEIVAWLSVLPVTDEDSLSHALRLLRKRVMLKLVTRDLGGWADLAEVTTCMTALAEITVQRAQAFVMQALVAQYGQPLNAQGAPQEMLVIGMGKLGGRELNVSSDIDLIFIYAEEGSSQGAPPISNHEFFSKLGRRLIKLLSDLTADGFVFRVDMRLRPYGDSGPLVMSFAALEEYLIAQGREWERYAWIKARVVSAHDSHELMQLTQPFIFRKYLDFGAFASMRKLHAQIRQEVQRRDRLNNIKLGPGGIREIEFIAQVFQLIRGGRDASLRIRPTLQVLQLLGKKGVLTPGTVEELSTAYIFLRNLEHRLQYLDDQQTHDLPDNSADQAALAAGMGCHDYPALLQQLNQHRSLVSEQFTQIFRTQKNEAEEQGLLWNDNLDAEALRASLQQLGYDAAMNLAELLLQVRDSNRYRHLPDSSRQLMEQLLPQFITLSASYDNRELTLSRVLKLLESISQRAAYLSFLIEYPQALARLVKIASASTWACDYLIQHPILLDELLDAREIYRAPDWEQLDLALQQQMTLDGSDMERQMDTLRQFQHSQTFHLLAMDLQGLLPLEKLSDHLSDLADLVLRHVLQLCWQNTRHKHQADPKYQALKNLHQPHFAIIAYGKLGGRELGYAADLDLIFLYEDAHPDAAEIYARLAQRINTLLSSYTSAGRLYETDLRLRPNGASGLLVSSLAAFQEYQQQHAWVWEHQALTRARFCAGDQHIGQQFSLIRNEVLRQPRELPALRQEIVAMRQKMLAGHPNHSELFDLKHDRGGMVDIEFMVQFLVLAHAHTHPDLTTNSGNLALLKRAGELGLIEVEAAEAIRSLYRTLRGLQHRMRLNNITPCRVPPGEIDTTPARVLWETLFEDSSFNAS